MIIEENYNWGYKMDDKVLQDVAKNIPGIGLSIFGGLVRIFNSKEHFSLIVILSEFITSMFVGIIVFLSIHDLPISVYMQGAIVGMSGYCSRDILQLLKSKTIKTIKKIKKY